MFPAWLDELILNKDPGFFYYSKQPGIRENNVNRQIVSTLAGLKVVKTKYVMKLRTDFRLTGSDFLKYFETQLKFNSDFRIFKHKVLACCYFTRNPRDKNYPYAYHPADIAFFGLTEDVIKLFASSILKHKDIYSSQESLREIINLLNEKDLISMCDLIAYNGSEQEINDTVNILKRNGYNKNLVLKK